MLEKISIMLRLVAPKKGDSQKDIDSYKKLSGEAGELITQGYLDLWKTRYFCIEQEYVIKPEWLNDGTRPDFIAFTSDPTEVILIDAKNHIPKDNKFFIGNKRLNEYQNLISKLSTDGRKAYLLFIMPIGGNSINYFYCYTLQDFLSGQDSNDRSGKEVTLSDPINAYDMPNEE